MRDSVKRLKVLYIHHAGIFGGASRSLLELIDNFPGGSVEARLLTQRGAVAELARRRGLEVIDAAGISMLDNTRYSYYRGKRWILVARELAWLAPTILALCKARRRWPDLDLIHLNEATMLPVFWLCRLLFPCPVAVHVRSVQRSQAGSLRTAMVSHMLRKADSVVCIDQTVRASLPDDIAARVVHNGLTLTQTPAPRSSDGPLRVAMVGNLLALKGVHPFIEAARLCKERGIDARFLLFGANVRARQPWTDVFLKRLGFRQDIESELRQMVEKWELQSMVEFRGFSLDLQDVYSNMDVLCFPSMLNAPGRPVFEAAYWGVPSIVAATMPSPDTLVDGETGVAIAEPSAEAIARAVTRFAVSRQEVRRMGGNARRLAERNFNSANNAACMLELYRSMLTAPGQGLNQSADARD